MLKKATTATEILMLAYWVLAFALVLGLIYIDPALMYSDYENDLVIAWNWSFLPIDVAFAVIGLSTKTKWLQREMAVKMEIISATLMICAGGMAVSFWAITGDCSLTWWAMNLWLVALGLTNLCCKSGLSAQQTV